MLSHIDPFRRRSVALALYRMLTGHKYDICVVTESIRAAGLDHDRQAIAALRLHHCERYAEMPPGFHADLASQTLALFAGRPVPPHRGGVDGDGFLKDLAATAGLRPEDAPSIQCLVSLPLSEGEVTAEA
ncbi:MAG: hypothetical protein CMJ44_00715 [Pimelobacter sp.]|nr:hypothetical protein [Pimelobacter sp.]